MTLTKTKIAFENGQLPSLSDDDVLFIDDVIKKLGMSYIPDETGILRSRNIKTGGYIMDYIFNYRSDVNPEEEITLVARGLGEESDLIMELALSERNYALLLKGLLSRPSIKPIYDEINLYSK